MQFKRREIEPSDVTYSVYGFSAIQRNSANHPACDFCDREPKFRYAAKRTNTGVEVECWRWLVCSECSMAIARHDYPHVEKKLVVWLRGRIGSHPNGVLQNVAHILFMDFVRSAVKE